MTPLTRADSPVVIASPHVTFTDPGFETRRGTSFSSFIFLLFLLISGRRATARMTVRIQLLLTVHLFEEDARLLVKIFSKRVFSRCVFSKRTLFPQTSYFRSLEVSEQLYLGHPLLKSYDVNNTWEDGIPCTYWGGL